MILTTEVAVLEWVRVRMLAFGSAVLCLRRKFQGAKPEENQLKHWARQTPPPFNTFVFCPFLSKVLLRHLLSSSLLPTLITLNTAVLTCAQVARWHGALDITSALKLVYNEHLVSVQTWSFQTWQNLNGNRNLESKEKCSSGCWQKYLQCSSLIFQLLWTMATCGQLDRRHDRSFLLARWYKLWCCFRRLQTSLASFSSFVILGTDSASGRFCFVSAGAKQLQESVRECRLYSTSRWI